MWPKLFSKKRDQKRQAQVARAQRNQQPASCCNQNCDQGRTCPARKSSGDTAAR